MLAKAPFKRRVKRNALIELGPGELVVVPWRAIRKAKANPADPLNPPVDDEFGMCAAASKSGIGLAGCDRHHKG